MKTIISQWCKSKRALALVLVTLIARGIEAVVEAEWMVLVPAILSSGNFRPYIMTFVIVSVVGVLSSAIREIAMKHSMRLYYTDVFNQYTKKILTADYGFFTKYSVSKLTTVQKFMADTSGFGRDIQLLIGFVIADIIYFYRMWKLGGVIVLPILGLGGIMIGLMIPCYKKHAKYDIAASKIQTKRNQMFEDSINGFREMRLFHRQEETLNAILHDNKEINKIGIRRGCINAINTGLVSTADKLVNVAICVYGITLIASGVWTAAQGIAIASLASSAIWNLLNIADFADDLGGAKGMSDQFAEVMSYEGEESSGEISIDHLESGIEIKDVRFQYENAHNVLNGLSMSIPAGSRIGICGSSGGGKTTLLNLLTKFFIPQSGVIEVDGTDLQEISNESFYRMVGVVSQEPTLFSGSIMANIRFGRPDATEYEVIEAAKKAQIYDFIQSQPKGFATDIGPNGIKLSGGQKQRIALARMLISNPSIIILDEATAALDNGTERLVQKVIDSLDHKTVITVAHRLTTIQNADIIYVLDKGKIAESGTHEELMKLNGIYAAMQTVKEEC